MKSFFAEFREFINKGNAMDMAVGIIIGGAFTAIVTSLTTDILNPFIKLVTGGADATVPGMTIPVPGTTNGIDFGAFIGAIINFLIIAFVVFCLVKAMNGMREAAEKAAEKITNKEKEETVEKAAPTCPFCLEEVKAGATRCPHCAGVFEKPAE